MVKGHLLLIEDERALRENLEESLSLEGFQVTAVSSGESGILAARKSPPDLIICDVMMRGYSGFDVLTILNQELITANIPFIFLTANTGADAHRLGMQLGADDFLTKPVQLQTLLESIEARLAKRDRQRLAQSEVFVRRLIQLQDEERATLSSLIDHEIGGALTGIHLILSQLVHQPAQIQKEALVSLGESSLDVLQRLQRLVARLNPTASAGISLLSMLFQLLEGFQAREGLQLQFDHEGIEDVFSSDLERVVYYVVEEALSNVARHAGVKQAFVRAVADDHMLQLEISDEGNGFALASTLQQQTSFTMMLLQERVRACGGTLHFSSAPDQGTRVVCMLPLKDDVPTASLPGLRPLAALAPASLTTPRRVSSTPKIRVMVANEHALVRRGLITVLAESKTVQVVCEAVQRDDLYQQMEMCQPDLLILDIAMYEQANLQLLQTLKSTAPTMPILFISNRLDSVYIWEGLRNGIQGCVFAGSAPEELPTAIHRLMEGKRFVSPVLMEHALDKLPQHDNSVFPQVGQDVLTAREREVLHWLVQGYTNAAIAEELTISLRTVETHRANLLKKLGLNSKAELIRYGLKRGMIDLNQ